jgi:4-hydroxy-tetrahydrodipicolinate reductase
VIEPFRTREMRERKNHVREPFKLIVWGPGGLGAICIREALRLREFELAGVRTYGPAKVGIDAGTLVGLDPVGVLLTDDVDALLAIDCDCILYTARDAQGCQGRSA